MAGFEDMTGERILIIKIGGMVLEQPRMLALIANEIADLRMRYRIVVVHGGGHAVSDISRLMGIMPYFHEGIRMTSAEEMPAVDMALCGLMNKRLARALYASGIPSVGIAASDGGLAIGEPLKVSSAKSLRTGHISQIDLRILHVLLNADFLPVLASPAMDEHGAGLNINADELAVEIGAIMGAGTLLFCSDVAGVLDSKRQLIKELTGEQIEQQIASGNIRGGMIAKARGCLMAVRKGVGRVIVGEYSARDDLEKMLRGSKGTRVIG